MAVRFMSWGTIYEAIELSKTCSCSSGLNLRPEFGAVFPEMAGGKRKVGEVSTSGNYFSTTGNYFPESCYLTAFLVTSKIWSTNSPERKILLSFLPNFVESAAYLFHKSLDNFKTLSAPHRARRWVWMTWRLFRWTFCHLPSLYNKYSMVFC